MPDSWSSPWRGVDGPWRGVGAGLNRRKDSVPRLLAVPRTCDLGGFVAMSARRDAFASGERATGHVTGALKVLIIRFEDTDH
jgi:hypothetical protein